VFSVQSVKLTSRIHLVPRLSMRGAVSPLSLTLPWRST
jgi:hypothetical protein